MGSGGVKGGYEGDRAEMENEPSRVQVRLVMAPGGWRRA